jgi:hypothetical protein
LAKNLFLFVCSLVFSVGMAILLKGLVITFNVPVFATVTISIFSSYILMLLSVLHNILSQTKRVK